MQWPEVTNAGNALDKFIGVTFYRDKVYDSKKKGKDIDRILMSVRKLDESVKVEEISTKPTCSVS